MDTPSWLRDKIVEYYTETTQDSYLATWSGETLGLHLGLSDDLVPITQREELDRAIIQMNGFLAERAAIDDGCRVLDAGCGVGGSSIWLARELRASVVGITLDPGQVELARAFAEQQGVSGVSFEVMDFAATRFPGRSFDVVWNLESLSHCAEPLAYLAHVHELLGEGGRFACADFFRGSAGDPADCDAMCEGWVLPNLHALEVIAERLEQLGFVEVEVVDLTARVLASAAAMGSFASSASFFTQLATAAGQPARPVHALHFNAAVAAERGLRSGSIVYGYVGARKLSG
jgi:ubiquinone/menaquinone biosynthesis C-methylase UbiE